MAQEKEKKTEHRKRNFTCIVYPDSAPENWIDILQNEHIPAFISPLHDKDINELDNELKKPHYHVIIMFDSLKTIEQAHEIFDLIGGVYPPETPKSSCVVKSIRGSARYLQHLDNPDKAYYGDKEVTCLAGADYFTVISLESDVFKTIVEMQEFCDKYDIRSFYLLGKYAAIHRTDWARALTTKCSLYMSSWLKSRQWSVQVGETCIRDLETGKIIFGTESLILDKDKPCLLIEDND